MRSALVVLSLLLASCSYDLSGFEFVGEDGGTTSPRVDGGGSCNPFTSAECGAMTTCSVLVRPATTVARCAGEGRGTPGTPCAGTGSCLPMLVCDAPATGDGTCTAFCTATRACPTGMTCDTAARTPFFTWDGTDAFRCR
ncbi:hypothetical protein [Sandaracinus amylolyticus]|uniref:Lipoprotein n=1 Tax=Sandaracinus amylolyticus TaxID=927083 RepID=A0A0F6YGU3_9BACT|nr:hypothetical protein [Sandaracinus amylolyticus]AKF05085.1 hypothetical protein DB32_002234 [Sandaracinus amylolyticus]